MPYISDISYQAYQKRGVNVEGAIIDDTLRGIRRVEIFAGIYGPGNGSHG